MKQVLFFALLIIQSWFPFLLMAQPVNPLIGDVTLPAPNAAALGKYGDIPVSYYTGVPSIGIPIYTVQQGPISLPISLGYHASGIKVGEVASWVGLGWSLNAGGMITRTVQGLPDDQTGGYYHSASELDIEDVEDLIVITQGSLDTEPDLFAFNFAGYSGKFYFDSDQNPQLVPIQDVQIEVILNNAVFTTFILTDSKGIRYIFGKDPDSSQSAIESSLSTGQSSSNYSSWYLIRIESSDDNHTISLTYEPDRYGYRTLATCRYIGKNCVNPDGQSFSYGTECTSDSYEVGFPNNRYTTTNISGYRVAQIATTTDTVNFLATTTRQDLDNNQHVQTDKKLLDAIEINSGNFCKKFTFSYDYFEDSAHSSVSEGKRLRLGSLQESDCTQTDTIPSYRFDYEGDGSFPFRLSKATDHWGFYNGANQNNSLAVAVPSTIVYLPDNTENIFGAANKETDTTATSTYIKQGVLNKITYPTGGFTEFTFEANEIVAPVSDTIVRDTFDLQQSSPFDDTFCGQVVQSDTFRFKTQGIIDSSIMRLHMVSVKTGNCTEPIYQQYLIEALLGGSVVGSISFDTVGMADSIAVHLDLGDLADFEVDSLYTFRLTTNECWGRFEIEYTSIIGMPALKKVGGLRIKKIRSHDGISVDNDIIREYDYSPPSSPGSSSGQLTAMPIYGQYMTGTHIVDDGTGGDQTLVNMVAFHEHSIVPISSFQGFHLAYRSVKEIFKDGGGNAGYTTYEYNVDVDQNALQSNYPFIPHQIQLKNGPVLEEIKYNSSGTIVSQVENDDFNGTFTRSGQDVIYKVAELASCPPGTGQILSKFVFISSYIIKSGAYLVSSTSSMLDGVTTVTHYSYDPEKNHLMPIEVEITNSDGKTSRMEYTFPTDSAGVAIYDSLILRNMLGSVAERTFVDHELVNGNWTKHSLFSDFPYPSDFYRYEATWNDGNLIGAWKLQGTIGAYNNGYPSNFTKTGWDTEYYTWTSSGLIDQRDFLDYTWDYEYHPGTRMVKKITDIDGQFIEYNYDDFMRLREIRARLDSVVTIYDYVYQAPEDYISYVKKETVFHPVPGSVLDTLTTFEYIDGLGRPIQTVEKAYSPNQKDVVRSIHYDNQGRSAVIYEPFESINAVSDTGGFVMTLPTSLGFTINTYEASPLNRLTGVKPPDWYTTITQYGKNTNTIGVPGTSISYGPGELFTQTIIEPDGNEGETGNRTINFTDKKGRLVFTQRAKNDGILIVFAASYYVYDDKDRLSLVVPPGAFASSEDLIYRYTYSGDDLILSKKLPGQDSTISYLYNSRDLLTFMQDGNLKDSTKWLHTHYDPYGRIIGTGFYNDTISNGSVPKNFSERLSTNVYGSSGIYEGKLLSTKRTILGTADTLLVSYDYDAYGRISETIGNNHLFPGTNGEAVQFEYDLSDNIISEQRTHRTYYDTLQIDQRWTYDHSGRKIGHFLDLDQAGEKQLCALDYTIKDQLKKKQLGYTGSGFLQSLDYTYLENGFLEKINEFDLSGSSNDPDDLFYLKLGYDTPDFSGATAAYNGNIADAHWRVRGQFAKAYRYRYDELNQLYDARYGAYSSSSSGSLIYTATYDANYSYDNRGNITGLSRNGLKTDGQGGFNPGEIDDLDYTYPGFSNRLASISDDASNFPELGFDTNGQGGSYGYDANGNLDMDPYKQLSIAYNYLNLPKEVTKNGGGKIEWRYDADGNKLQRKVTNNVLSLTGIINSGTYQADQIEAAGVVIDSSSVRMIGDSVVTLLPGFEVEAGSTFSAEINDTGENVHDYVGNVEYQDGKLEAIYFEEGRAFFLNDTFRLEFSIQDHLGNTRVIFADLDGNGQVNASEILQEEHYYPFGYTHEGAWNFHPDKNSAYLYNGIERNENLGLNWDLATFRSYDAAIGRWIQIDPRAEKYYGMTPYNGMGNNPILIIDPLGDTLRISGSEQFVRQVNSDIALISSSSDAGAELVEFLQTHESDINITEASSTWGSIKNFFSEGSGDANHVTASATTIDPQSGDVDLKYSQVGGAAIDGITSKSDETLFHEFVHTKDFLTNIQATPEFQEMDLSEKAGRLEARAVQQTNNHRRSKDPNATIRLIHSRKQVVDTQNRIIEGVRIVPSG